MISDRSVLPATGPSDVEVVTADALENSRSSGGEVRRGLHRGRGTDDVDASWGPGYKTRRSNQEK